MLKPPHLSVSPNWRIKPQEAEKQCDAHKRHPSVKRFDAHTHKDFFVENRKISYRLGNVIIETFGVKRATYAAADYHMQTVENHQSLEKMLKIHTVVQRNHKHNAQASIRHATAD